MSFLNKNDKERCNQFANKTFIFVFFFRKKNTFLKLDVILN